MSASCLKLDLLPIWGLISENYRAIALITQLALAAILAYQRHISPHKGFCCAYRQHTGRASCSSLGYRAIRRHGLLGGFALLHKRTGLCGVAHRRYSPEVVRPFRSQRGDCDLLVLPCDSGCDLGCNLPSGKNMSWCCDLASNCGSCDWPERKRKDKLDKDVYIPPPKSKKEKV
ncbi:MAG: membrane protein insertion efficiency factor YidD [Sulfuricellaceae bacterium]|nr:membrane protein insertion efficiency factor YidD [Sulfuricellaceae bacterium]